MADVISSFARQPDADCASEPIHIPGGIQPHGLLFCVSDEGVVLQVSENVQKLLGVSAACALGAPLGKTIGEPAAALVGRAVANRQVGTGPFYAWVVDRDEAAHYAGMSYAIIVHRYREYLIVELEPAVAPPDMFPAIYPLVRNFVHDLPQRQTVAELSQLAAAEIQQITGFGRTLVYRFDEQGHGHVLAEALAPGYTSYLGQRFPASDIPLQARELYRLNRIRLIVDANYTPTALVPQLHPATHTLTDLTYATLRSVSPVHLRYMRNIGTLSSMSMSIVVNDKLWGLISCHHATPRLPPFEVRAACEHIAQILSLQIEAREMHAEAAYRLELRQTLARLIESMADRNSFVDALAEDGPDLLGLMGASGAAIVFEGATRLIGVTPTPTETGQLVSWLDTRTEDVFATDHLSGECDAIATSAGFAGFLSVSISSVFRNYVIWFRREVVRTVEWAGDPRAKLADLPEARSPRQSFDVWTETVSGRTVPWRRAEIEIASEFRTALLAVVLRRAEELGKLTVELGRANRELEGFSYTISHDLRAPLRHIKGFADLIAELGADELSPRLLDYLNRIRNAATFGAQLVDDLLAFSQLGRASLKPQMIDIRALTESLVAEQQAEKDRARIRWHLRDLPPIEADPVFVQLALRNLIENAVKFSAAREQPVIEIAGTPRTVSGLPCVTFSVRDNGVGFDMRYADKLFGIFQRLHGERNIPGTGIGLATVHRVAERHGGSVDAEGRPNQGATISITLPCQFREESGTRSETAATAFARLAVNSDGAVIQGVPKEKSAMSDSETKESEDGRP